MNYNKSSKGSTIIQSQVDRYAYLWMCTKRLASTLNYNYRTCSVFLRQNRHDSENFLSSTNSVSTVVVNIGPRLHFLQVHHFSIGPKSILRIAPVSADGRLWPPSESFLQPSLHSIFESVNDLNAYSWHCHESHATPSHGHYKPRVFGVPIDQEDTIRSI